MEYHAFKQVRAVASTEEAMVSVPQSECGAVSLEFHSTVPVQAVIIASAFFMKCARKRLRNGRFRFAKNSRSWEHCAS